MLLRLLASALAASAHALGSVLPASACHRGDGTQTWLACHEAGKAAWGRLLVPLATYSGYPPDSALSCSRDAGDAPSRLPHPSNYSARN